MKASEFIRKLKEQIHEKGYKTSDLIIDGIDSHGSDCYEVYLYDNNEESIYIVIEKD